MSPNHADPPHVELHGVGIPHASMKDYAIGFGASVVLTAIPFALIMTGALPAAITVPVILLLAVVQIIVHMVFFLHMSPRAEGGWSMVSLIFTIIVVFIMLAGSLWVMSHLHDNMMPMAHEVPAAP